ncbi:pleckstrin homology domain-containing family A member 6 isoform X8 [Xenopus laevis]|uniref:Pleckstrin homology domain-containing family A member 6 isoform X8 n=1 Tax=Xenopus laevis TaxID=8355 RepID=A0A8J0UK46_XENLA|nr:pleckstrin homology domain-containing family A member 6 isoform X8 [Xenopus laevis]
MSSEASGKSCASQVTKSSAFNMVSDSSLEGSVIRPSRLSKKGIAFGKRSNSMKRNPDAKVMKTGWLYKQASSGVKQWNKRWFVLVDRCLFYYKDEKEEVILGSIPLLSFRIAPVQPSDNISRKHTFKVTVCCIVDVSPNITAPVSWQAEHAGVRTYFFSAESRMELELWLRVMGEASQVQNLATPRLERQDNIPPIKDCESETRSRGEGDGRGSEKMENRSESKDEPLTKVIGRGVPPDRPPDLQPPRHLPEGEQPMQPNEWGFPPSSGRPASTAFSESQRHGNLPQTHPTKMAQRQNSMSQLQQWVNLKRAAAPTEEAHGPSGFFSGSLRIPEYYSQGSPQYLDGYQYYNTPASSRPDSICSMPAFDRGVPQWGTEDKRQIHRNLVPYYPRDWKEPGNYGHQTEVLVPCPQLYYQETDAVCGSLRRLSLQPRSQSVPRSPSHGAYNTRPRVYSPVHFPSARFDGVTQDDIFGEPTTYTMRRSISSPKYGCIDDRHPLPVGVYSYSYPVSAPPHDKMMSESETLISMVNNMVHSSPRAQIFMQVSPYADPYREALQSYKINEQDTDKLLGQLCEQHKAVREQDRLVQQLRAEKESLESALMGTHQEMEMFGNQTAFTENLLHRKESLQNQLISIRVELSQATTALNNSSLEYEALEGEVSALHDTLWEQLNLNIQNELMNRQIQREIWRIQDVMEGLRKNNSSRGTDTAKHHVLPGPSATFSSNSPASPISSASLTSPVSPFSLISGSQGSPTKQTTSEERPKSALFPSEVKSKMSVEEQNDRMKRHQSGSVKEKRRSLQLQQSEPSATKSVATCRIVRRHRSIHEVDISDLEAALRSQEPQSAYESPQNEIARLRKMKVEPQAYSVDITRELPAPDKLSTPEKVLIPERYVELEPEGPLSPEEMQEKRRKVERIKTLIAKSSLQNVIPLSDLELEVPPDPESQLHEQEKRIELSCTLAAEASRRGRLLSALCATPSPPSSPKSPVPQILPISPEHSAMMGSSSSNDSAGEYGANIMCV